MATGIMLKFTQKCPPTLCCMDRKLLVKEWVHCRCSSASFLTWIDCTQRVTSFSGMCTAAWIWGIFSLAGPIQIFCPARSHSPRKSRRNPGFPGQNFSIEKNSFLRPRFLGFPGPGEEIFLHRYFRDRKWCYLHGILLKKGSNHVKILYRPRQEITEVLTDQIWRKPQSFWQVRFAGRYFIQIAIFYDLQTPLGLL